MPTEINPLSINPYDFPMISPGFSHDFASLMFEKRKGSPSVKLVDAEVRWLDLRSSRVPPNDAFLCVHLKRLAGTGQEKWEIMGIHYGIYNIVIFIYY